MNHEKEWRDLLFAQSCIPALLWLTTSTFNQTQASFLVQVLGLSDSQHVLFTAHRRQGESRVDGWRAA